MITLAGGGRTIAPTPAFVPLGVIAPVLGTYLTILSYQLDLVNEPFGKLTPVILRREGILTGAANRIDVREFGRTFIPYSMAVTRAGGIRVFVYVSTLMHAASQANTPAMPPDIRNFFSTQKARFQAAAEGAGVESLGERDEADWVFRLRDLIYGTLYPNISLPLAENVDAWWQILEGPFAKMSEEGREESLHLILDIVRAGTPLDTE